MTRQSRTTDRRTFTFELRFSEEPKEGFSDVTLRDHAFTVTSGDRGRGPAAGRGQRHPPTSAGR